MSNWDAFIIKLVYLIMIIVEQFDFLVKLFIFLLFIIIISATLVLIIKGAWYLFKLWHLTKYGRTVSYTISNRDALIIFLVYLIVIFVEQFIFFVIVFIFLLFTLVALVLLVLTTVLTIEYLWYLFRVWHPTKYRNNYWTAY